MRKRILNTVCPGVLLLSALFFSTESDAATVTVHVGPGGASGSNTYGPEVILIGVGDVVRWIWDSDNHSVTSGTPAQPTGVFDSGVQNLPFTFSHTFTQAGSFPYFSLTDATMIGTVEVSNASTVSLLPQKDNTLYDDPQGLASNGHGIYLFAGITFAQFVRRGLVEFDLTSIPANATVTGATFSMFLSRSHGSSAISLQKVLRDWGEGASDAGDPGGLGTQSAKGDATWLHNFFDTSFWTTPGGDFSPTLSATTTISRVNVGTTYSWSGQGLLADVQAWITSPATNFGWIIRGNEIDLGTANRFNTREDIGNPPQLTVTYQVSSSTPTPTPTAMPSVLGNFSTRLLVQTGDNVLIGGFIVSGTQPKRVILRAMGPSMPFAGALADPILELHNSSGSLIAFNDNWRSTQEPEIIATTIPPSNNLESAIVATLPANNSAYTAVVRGVNNTTGLGLLEVYDLDRTVDSKLADVSTRGLVQTGNNVLIGGLIVLGQAPLRVIARAIGPSLLVPGALADPTLELHDSNGAVVAFNDNWRSDQEAEIIATTIPPSSNLESAIVRNLPPGNYTAIARGVNNATGVALVEIYSLN